MTVRDWVIAGSMTVGSFVLTFVNYWFPAEKIFDEIYYARAGEEYLQAPARCSSSLARG